MKKQSPPRPPSPSSNAPAGSPANGAADDDGSAERETRYARREPERSKIPRCMSTQHPDNASPPFFADAPALGPEAEIQEAHHVFSRLGCDEQMWDHEGKEVDSFVVSKLLTRYESYFRAHLLGRDVFLTVRIPNPARERGMAKVLLEVLESIPRSFDLARQFYRRELAPIFEIILPMTTEARELNRVWHYYRDFVAGKADRPVMPGDVSLRRWIGDFAPREIQMIPLIEDRDSMLQSDRIVEEYAAGKALPYVRVFLARSDPAMSYGATGAVLLLKIALARLHRLEGRLGIPLYPIVGLGSAPFRGNLKPTHIDRRLAGYPSVQTFTLQSAFKFDYPEELVCGAIRQLKAARRGPPVPVEREERVIAIVDKVAATYVRQVGVLAPLVAQVAPHVPARRKRRLHVGLFGYARAVAGTALPRAIGFCASLYSLGLPPELLGLADLTPSELSVVRAHYPNFDLDLADAVKYLDPEAVAALPHGLSSELQRTLRRVRARVEPEPIHQALTRAIRRCLERGDHGPVSDLITQAARERRFLG